MKSSYNNLTGILFLFFFFISTNIYFTQQVKITRILDSNLFELTDGSLIKLAGVDVPSIKSTNSNKSRIAIRAKIFAENFLLNRELNFKTIKKSDSSLYTFGILSRDYPTTTINYSIYFLSKGFGKFINNLDTLKIKKYLLTEKESIRKKEGIWEFTSNDNNETFDYYAQDKSNFPSIDNSVAGDSAQKNIIVKIIDSNLFELTDGSLIKLANVDSPNINYGNLMFREIGIDAYRYAQKMLLRKNLDFNYLTNNSFDTNYSLVSIISKYVLFNRDFSEEYLRIGFGKFIANTDDTDTMKYKYAERKARNNLLGVWKFENFIGNDTLDQSFLSDKFFTKEGLDTLANYKPIVRTNTLVESILIETIVAPVMGALSGLATGLVSYVIGSGIYGNSGHGMGAGLISLGGVYIGYIIGNAIGVNFVAKKSDREVTIDQTLLASFIGAGISYVMINNKAYVDNSYLYPPLILPGLVSIIYANFIAPKKEVKQNLSQSNMNNINLIEKKLTHKDLYNSTKIFEMNLFKINF